MAKKVEIRSYYDPTGNPDVDAQIRDQSIKIVAEINRGKREHKGRTIIYMGIVRNLPELNLFFRSAQNCLYPEYTNYFYYDAREKILYWCVK